MKAFRIFTTAFSLGAILLFTGCGGSNTPAESTQDKQLRLLSQTWKAATVTFQTDDVSTAWKSFQLTISGTKGNTTFNYSCAGRPTTSGPWDASGTWKFGTDPVTQIIRIEDNLNMTYVVTETTLTLNFTYNGPGFKGRSSNVGGNWVYNFTL